MAKMLKPFGTTSTSREKNSTLKRLIRLPKPRLQCLELQHTKENNYYGCFSLGPFPIGRATTMANTLRRVLLSDLSGVAIVEVEFLSEKTEFGPFKRCSNMHIGAERPIRPTHGNNGNGNEFSDPITLSYERTGGVKTHELSILPGLRESILELLFNIQKTRFQNVFPFLKPQQGRLFLSKKGKGFFNNDL